MPLFEPGMDFHTREGKIVKVIRYGSSNITVYGDDDVVRWSGLPGHGFEGMGGQSGPEELPTDLMWPPISPVIPPVVSITVGTKPYKNSGTYEAMF